MDILVSTVKQIIVLANARQQVAKLNPRTLVCDGESFQKHLNSPEHKAYQECNDRLREYISSLDYNQILDLEAVMLSGREDGYTFHDYRKDFDQRFSNPSGKNMAITYIMEKAPLGEYLYRGLKRLGLE